jgi:hypothetical protein
MANYVVLDDTIARKVNSSDASAFAKICGCFPSQGTPPPHIFFSCDSKSSAKCGASSGSSSPFVSSSQAFSSASSLSRFVFSPTSEPVHLTRAFRVGIGCAAEIGCKALLACAWLERCTPAASSSAACAALQRAVVRGSSDAVIAHVDTNMMTIRTGDTCTVVFCFFGLLCF